MLAPTGTIGLLMDCDTTGIEPDFSLVKFKKLAGGGYFKIINQSIPRALGKLGYSEVQIEEIITYVLGHATLEGAPYVDPESLRRLGFSDEQIVEAQKAIWQSKGFDEWTPQVNPKSLRAKGLSDDQIAKAAIYIGGAQTVEGAPNLKEEHLSVFDCANKCGIGQRFIDPMGHIKMMASVQPFISGAISKTVNIPTESTVQDIEKIYIEAWKLGLKAVALYRDGCKLSQPLSSGTKIEAKGAGKEDQAIAPVIRSRTLPQKRSGITHEALVGGHHLLVRTGEFADGSLGEISVSTGKQGSTMDSLMDCLSQAVSIGLAYGVPFEKYVEKLTFTRFEPQGMTNHVNVKTCTSVVDFVFRVLAMEYLDRTDLVHVKPKDTRKSQVMAPLSGGGVALVKEDQSFSQAELAIAKDISKDTANNSVQNSQQKDALSSHLGEMMGDAPPCTDCGHITVRNATCYKCLNCGNSMGCS